MHTIEEDPELEYFISSIKLRAFKKIEAFPDQA